MPPVYAAYADGTPGSGTTAAVSAPTRAVGDLLIAHLYVNVASISALAATGWTLVGGVTVVSSPVVLADFSRAATNTAADNFAATWTGSSVYAHAGMSRVTGASASRPFDVVGAGNSGTSRAPVGRGVTTAVADTLLLMSVCTDNPATVTPPSGFTAQDRGAGVAVLTTGQAVAGASGDKTAALSVSTIWTTRMLAITPTGAAAVRLPRLTLLGVG